MRRLRPGVNSRSVSNLLAIQSVGLETADTTISPFPTPPQILAREQSCAIGAGKKRPARRLEKKCAHMLTGQEVLLLSPCIVVSREGENPLRRPNQKAIVGRFTLRNHLTPGR